MVHLELPSSPWIAFQKVDSHHASTTPNSTKISNKFRWNVFWWTTKGNTSRNQIREEVREKLIHTQFFSRSNICSMLWRKSFPLGGVVSSSFFTRSSQDFISSFYNHKQTEFTILYNICTYLLVYIWRRKIKHIWNMNISTFCYKLTIQVMLDQMKPSICQNSAAANVSISLIWGMP